MKEHPILFSAPMVRAILEGRKTQTRRVIKGLPIDADRVWHDGGEWIIENAARQCWTGKFTFPKGQVGDRLWVRETVQVLGHWVKNGTTSAGRQKWRFVIHESKQVRYTGDFTKSPTDKTELGFYTRPAIHAPRWTSRFTLEITGLRAERVQDISETDAVAEGIEIISGDIQHLSRTENHPNKPVFKCYNGFSSGFVSPKNSFESLWESINGEGQFDENPFVWAITFKQVEK